MSAHFQILVTVGKKNIQGWSVLKDSPSIECASFYLNLGWTLINMLLESVLVLLLFYEVWICILLTDCPNLCLLYSKDWDNLWGRCRFKLRKKSNKTWTDSRYFNIFSNMKMTHPFWLKNPEGVPKLTQWTLLHIALPQMALFGKWESEAGVKDIRLLLVQFWDLKMPTFTLIYFTQLGCLNFPH